jgi:hypothetical protein
MTYQGRVKDGAIVVEPGADLPEGAHVRIEIDLPASVSSDQGSDPLLRMSELAVETGVSDLATNIDHYLYGHPKQDGAS